MGTRWSTAAVATACIVFAACCGSSSKGATRTEPSTTTVVRLAPQTVLRRVSLQPSDLVAPYKLKTFDGGDRVADQVTLDLCGGSFPSEALRRFRHQIGVETPSGSDTPMSTEAVLYNRAAGAAQALTELKAEAKHCPPGFVQGTVEGQPPLRYEFGPAPDAGWAQNAGVNRYGLSFTVADRKGESQHSSGYFQVRDRLVVILYVFDSDGGVARILAPSLGGVHGLVNAIARRMAALSPAQLQASTAT